MNIKEEILGRLKELIILEGQADAAYVGIEREISNENLKRFFKGLSEEEKGHARLISSLIEIMQEETYL